MNLPLEFHPYTLMLERYSHLLFACSPLHQGSDYDVSLPLVGGVPLTCSPGVLPNLRNDFDLLPVSFFHFDQPSELTGYAAPADPSKRLNAGMSGKGLAGVLQINLHCAMTLLQQRMIIPCPDILCMGILCMHISYVHTCDICQDL